MKIRSSTFTTSNASVNLFVRGFSKNMIKYEVVMAHVSEIVYGPKAKACAT